MNRLSMVTALISAVLVGATSLWLDKDGVAEGAEREITEHERKMMQVTREDVDRAIKEFKLNRKNIVWGKERRANRTTVIVLDPPLRRLGGHDAVEVEGFFTSVDNNGGQEAGWRAQGVTNGGWLKSLLASGNPVRYYWQSMGQGPYLNPEWDEARRWYQKLRMGWGRFEASPRRMVDLEVHRMAGALWHRRDKQYLIETEEDAKRFMTLNALPFKEWEDSIARPQIQSVMREADERWAEIAVRGTEHYPRAFQALPDPVLLINGKYLLTRNTVKRQGGSPIRNIYQIANWIIRQELERLPQYGFDEVKITWGNFKRPKRGRKAEVVELDSPFPSEPGILVEWAHTYVSGEGEPTPIRWLEKVQRLWAESLKGAGMEGVRMGRIPLVEKAGRTRVHQAVHRVASIAWGPELPGRQNLIHLAMADHLASDPLGLGSHEEVGELLEGVENMSRQVYEAVRTSAGRVKLLDEAKAKGEAIARALAGKKRTDPVFLVNGRYVVATEDATRTFQVLNWLVRRLHERG